jgi:Zn-dependent M32 family carboxypeptidase
MENDCENIKQKYEDLIKQTEQTKQSYENTKQIYEDLIKRYENMTKINHILIIVNSIPVALFCVFNYIPKMTNFILQNYTQLLHKHLKITSSWQSFVSLIV